MSATDLTTRLDHIAGGDELDHILGELDRYSQLKEAVDTQAKNTAKFQMDLEEQISCDICQEIMIETVAFSPCGHTGCELCVARWINEHLDRPVRRPRCFLCRENISLGTPYITNISLKKVIAHWITGQKQVPGGWKEEKEYLEREKTWYDTKGGCPSLVHWPLLELLRCRQNKRPTARPRGPAPMDRTAISSAEPIAYVAPQSEPLASTTTHTGLSTVENSLLQVPYYGEQAEYVLAPHPHTSSEVNVISAFTNGQEPASRSRRPPPSNHNGRHMPEGTTTSTASLRPQITPHPSLMRHFMSVTTRPVDAHAGYRYFNRTLVPGTDMGQSVFTDPPPEVRPIRHPTGMLPAHLDRGAQESFGNDSLPTESLPQSVHRTARAYPTQISPPWLARFSPRIGMNPPLARSTSSSSSDMANSDRRNLTSGVE